MAVTCLQLSADVRRKLGLQIQLRGTCRGGMGSIEIISPLRSRPLGSSSCNAFRPDLHVHPPSTPQPRDQEAVPSYPTLSPSLDYAPQVQVAATLNRSSSDYSRASFALTLPTHASAILHIFPLTRTHTIYFLARGISTKAWKRTAFLVCLEAWRRRARWEVSRNVQKVRME